MSGKHDESNTLGFGLHGHRLSDVSFISGYFIKWDTFLFVLSCWHRKEISQELNVALTWLITDRNQDPEWAPDWLHRILSRRLMWGRLSFNIQSWLPSRQSSESLILLEVLCQKQEFCSQGRGLRECNLNVACTLDIIIYKDDYPFCNIQITFTNAMFWR